MIYSIYKNLASLSRPLLHLLGAIRAHKGKEIKSRKKERYGIPSMDRPMGQIVWFHAASNGETLSAFPLIDELRSQNSDIIILITTMTVTASN